MVLVLVGNLNVASFPCSWTGSLFDLQWITCRKTAKSFWNVPLMDSVWASATDREHGNGPPRIIRQRAFLYLELTGEEKLAQISILTVIITPWSVDFSLPIILFFKNELFRPFPLYCVSTHCRCFCSASTCLQEWLLTKASVIEMLIFLLVFCIAFDNIRRKKGFFSGVVGVVENVWSIYVFSFFPSSAYIC